MDKELVRSEIDNAKTLAMAAGVVAIIAGIIWSFTMIGLLWSWLDIIGGILLIRSKGFSDEKFATKSNGLLIFGLIFLVTSLLGGILAILAYFKLNSVKKYIQPENQRTDFMSLEKAFELKEKGIISEEEFEKVKTKSLA